ncbi:Protein ARV1 [Lamellibrachia satsuma]|nr:Protein ARV1 [Lamellibrachia satsuma]
MGLQQRRKRTVSHSSEPCQYRCIECGYEAVELYKDFKAGIIKISHCVSCHKVVDKYIEFDPVIIFLDALLHKPQAYRHLLFNDKFKAPGRLLLIFLLCDTYLKWESLQTDRPHPPGVHLLRNSRGRLLQDVCPCNHRMVSATHNKVSTSLLVWSLVVSSFGKLLAIPAILWGQTHSAIYMILANVFIFTSNVSALKVLCPVGRLGAVVILGSAHLLQAFIGHHLFCWTSSHHLSNTSTPVIAYLSSVASWSLTFLTRWVIDQVKGIHGMTATVLVGSPKIPLAIH